MARWRVAFALLLGAACAFRPIDVESGGPPGFRPTTQQPGLGVPPTVEQGRSVVGSAQGAIGQAQVKFSKWYRAYQGFVAGAAKLSHVISFASGGWLIFAAPFSMVGSIVFLRVDEAALIMYLALYGVLMLGMEVPLSAVQRVLQQYFRFVYTRPGRAAFVLHVAVVAWTCKHIGFVTKALMAFNALLTFYILQSQDRRFAQVDADAKEALQQASDEMRGSVSNAMPFLKMFSGAFGGSKGRSSAGGTAGSNAGAPDAFPGGGFPGGGFSSPPPGAMSSAPAWPSSSGNDA